MSQPGVVMRFAHLHPDAAISTSIWAPRAAVPDAEAIYQVACDIDEEPRFGAFYFVSDISKVTRDPSYYGSDVRNNSEFVASLSWVVVSYINGRCPGRGSPDNGPQTPSIPPPKGTIIVANGSSPRSEWIDDYHAWYDQEHGGKLGKVPGWQLMRRYKLEKVYGDVPTASFYGVNFYDEKNGLGGPEWKEGVTAWTNRIRDQAEKPNIRRVWKLVDVL